MKALACGMISLFLTTNLFSGKLIEPEQEINSQSEVYENTMKQDILIFMMAYPEYVVNVEKDDGGNVYVVMKSGKSIVYDDMKKKSHEEKLANPDLQDVLEQIYPLKHEGGLMDLNYDPGRGRNYELLNEVYGGCNEIITQNLTNVSGGGGNYRFNKNNKAAESLKKALKDIGSKDIKKSTSQGDYLFPINGTFNYRQISGTGRLSPHAYGIALDLNSNSKDYWKWAKREDGEKRMKSYPKDIVEVFENNNFVWGGKWGHFDILHFEYRPEIILKARYFGDTNREGKQWYEGVPMDDQNIKSYINIIENTFK